MKKTFDFIKQIFIDNKEYFIKCTLMSIIAAFILGLAISFVVPASAADDPTESDQIVIPAGTYRFHDQLTDYSLDGGFTYSLEGYCHAFVVSGDMAATIAEAPFSYFYCGGTDSEDGLGTLPTFRFEPSTDTVRLASYKEGRGGWLAEYNLYVNSGVSISGDTSLLNLFTVTTNTSVDSSFGSWFFDNVYVVGDPVDPDPDQYIISQGSYYLATPTNLPFELYDDGEFFFQSGGYRFSSLRSDTFAIIYGNNVTNTPRRVYTFVGENQGYNDFTLRSITILKDLVVTETTYNNFFASYKAVDESDEYQAGYEAGYNEGSSSGYDQGYQDGLNASAGSSDTFLGSIIEGVVDALDKLVIIGEFSVLDIIKTVIGGFVVVFLLKLIAGG